MPQQVKASCDSLHRTDDLRRGPVVAGGLGGSGGCAMSHHWRTSARQQVPTSRTAGNSQNSLCLQHQLAYCVE